MDNGASRKRPNRFGGTCDADEGRAFDNAQPMRTRQFPDEGTHHAARHRRLPRAAQRTAFATFHVDARNRFREMVNERMKREMARIVDDICEQIASDMLKRSLFGPDFDRVESPPPLATMDMPEFFGTSYSPGYRESPYLPDESPFIQFENGGRITFDPPTGDPWFGLVTCEPIDIHECLREEPIDIMASFGCLKPFLKRTPLQLLEEPK